jgi:hypothetical protein
MQAGLSQARMLELVLDLGPEGFNGFGPAMQSFFCRAFKLLGVFFRFQDWFVVQPVIKIFTQKRSVVRAWTFRVNSHLLT